MQPIENRNLSSEQPASAWLQLLHLADSALPIGAMSHSFGLESLAAEAGLAPDGLEAFFSDWIGSAGRLEAAFCLLAASITDEDQWYDLNMQLSSFKPARESRDASLRLGKRFLALAASLTGEAALGIAGDAHLATAFGRVGDALSMHPVMVASAYLHQGLFGAISACQRLLPLGQSAAMRLLWALKPEIVEAVEQASRASLDDLWNLQPMLEIASMRHPHLATRLFIS